MNAATVEVTVLGTDNFRYSTVFTYFYICIYDYESNEALASQIFIDFRQGFISVQIAFQVCVWFHQGNFKQFDVVECRCARRFSYLVHSGHSGHQADHSAYIISKRIAEV
uniref:Uncharacterized protein n=1 Tax=Tetranychus urticae TaxID=32264 RepID=T1K4W2_TETUR